MPNANYICPEPIAATAGSGTINAENGKAFTFSSPVDSMVICNDSAYDLVVKINGTQANKSGSDWTLVVKAETTFTYESNRYAIDELAVYCADGAPTYQTDFAISGFAWWE